jgi:hypothetical protein
MPRRILALGSVVLATLIAPADRGLAQAPAAALQAPIGKVLVVEGTVTVEHAATVVRQVSAASGAARPKAGDLVYQGDIVQTGPDSKINLAFADGTAFNVGGNARMELNEFVYNPNGKNNSSLFSLVKGTFTFVAGKVAKTGDMKIDTPAATMGIRGTTPRVEVLEDGTVKFSTLVEKKR